MLLVPSLRDAVHKVLYTKDRCAVPKWDKIVGNGKCDKGMYSIKLEKAEYQALTASDEDSPFLEACHRRLAQADHYVIQWTKQTNVVKDMDMSKLSTSKNCAEWIQGTMTKMQIKARRHVEMRPGVVVHNDGITIVKRASGRAINFVIFIDKAYEFLKAIHMKIVWETTKLLKGHAI